LISDGVVNENEQVFLSEFTLKLGLNKINQNTGYELVEFINKNKNNLPFYNLNHPVKQFYTNTQDNIAKLVSRNKTRLLKELSESKELVKLLGKSTQSELSFEKESKKTVIRHLQKHSVANYFFTSRWWFIITNFDKIYSTIIAFSV
jgi:hypothetical protein